MALLDYTPTNPLFSIPGLRPCMPNIRPKMHPRVKRARPDNCGNAYQNDEENEIARSYRGLEDLPVELIYDIHILSHSPSIPLVSRQLSAVASNAPPAVRARYLISSHLSTKSSKWVFSYALRFPLCNLDVFMALERIWGGGDEEKIERPMVDLDAGLYQFPKRLFRNLPSSSDPKEMDDAYQLISHVLAHYPFNANSHNGYPLAMAVRASHNPLIKLLLEKGAQPGVKKGMPIRIAIAKRDLELIRLLVEPEGEERRSGSPFKRRRLQDRVEVTPSMLQLAVKLDARDIVRYFVERGCVPDMPALRMMP